MPYTLTSVIKSSARFDVAKYFDQREFLKLRSLNTEFELETSYRSDIVTQNKKWELKLRG